MINVDISGLYTALKVRYPSWTRKKDQTAKVNLFWTDTKAIVLDKIKLY